MKIINYKIQLPNNFQQTDGEYFQKESLTFIAPKIRVVKNANITHNGIVSINPPYKKSFSLVYYSIYGGQGDYSEFKSETEEIYRDSKATGDIVHLDKKRNYINIITPWSYYCYYHWILDSIPRLLAVYNKIKNPVLLLWDFYDHYPFIKESLKPFKNLEFEILKHGQTAFADKIILPGLRCNQIQYEPDKVKLTRKIYTDYFGKNEKATRRIYITRRNAAKRKVVNEDEVTAVLEKYGFTILDCDKVPFGEQVSTICSAQFLVTIHGSGLTNLIFLQKDCSVLEFFKKRKRPTDGHNKTFWYLSSLLGLRYYQQSCDSVNDQYEDDLMNYFFSDLYVNIPQLENNIKLMLSQE